MTAQQARVYNENLAQKGRLIIDKTLAKEYNIMSKDTTLMGTRAAAAYLNMRLATFKYHVEKGHLTPILIGRTRLFTQAQLDDFQAHRRKPGRPPKPKD